MKMHFSHLLSLSLALQISCFATPRIVNPSALNNMHQTINVVKAEDLIKQLKTLSPDQMHAAVLTHGSMVVEFARQLKTLGGDKAKLTEFTKICDALFSQISASLNEAIKALNHPEGQSAFQGQLKALSTEKIKEMEDTINKTLDQLKDIDLSIMPYFRNYYMIIASGITNELRQR